MPLPPDTRYRYRRMPNMDRRQRRQRLAFNPQGDVIEVKTYSKENGKWVQSHKRRKPKR